MRLLRRLLFLAGVVWQTEAYNLPVPQISVLQPQGVRFEIVDNTAGLSLIAFHYNINAPLAGVQAGQHNVDVHSQGGRFVHENRQVRLNPGDTVYYWVYALVSGGGHQRTGQSWTYSQPKITNPPSATTLSPRPQITTTARVATIPPSDHQGCATAIPSLRTWNPGHDVNNRVTISGERLLLSSSATVYSIEIKNGGILVFADNADITLRARYVLIRDAGELHVGSESCRHRSRARIELYGRSTDNVEVPPHGQKFIAVERGGTLEIHGQDKMSWTLLESSVAAGSVNPTVTLTDDASSWRAGDRVVISSTDYSMDQAEEFTINRVAGKQLYLTGTSRYLHFGSYADGVDMRAEVGLLSRNVVVTSQTESACYGSNRCEFFPNLDTFGGHMIFHKGFRSVHLEGLEVTKMGQQMLARYPVHFHLCDAVDGQGGYAKPAYVKQASIHHCFHRCVTIHGTDGLLVKDTVGYDTLGHCYFLEDGAERRNVLDHNLGLVTRPSTVLPSDRDTRMCQAILDGALPGYKPDENECNAVTTFWITHPENTVINNAAGGSDKVGFWYLFHEEPSGPSKGKLPRGHSNRAPLTRFYNNRAHSNQKNALIIDNGVKTTPPDPNGDRRLQFSVGAGLYTPHVNSDSKLDRAPAIIERFVAFKNSIGMWARGGDIFVKDSQFGDNGLAMTLASAGELPHDPGSHQEVVNSIFVGESINRGTFMMSDSKSNYKGCPTKGSDGIDRVGPCAPWIIGFQIYDGPVKVEGCTFRKYWGPPNVQGQFRNAALAFFVTNPNQMSTTNTLLRNSYDSMTRRVWTGVNDWDGDKTIIAYDQDGTTTGVRDSYFMRPENTLTQHAGCQLQTEWNALVCSGRNAMVWFTAPGSNLLTLVRDEFPNAGVQLKGVVPSVFQPVMMLSKTYTANWNTRAPNEVRMRIVNFNQGEWLRVGLCYPSGANFEVYYEIEYNGNSRVNLNRRYSLAEVDNAPGDSWYWEESTGLLFVKVQARAARQGWYYCSVKGCEMIVIKYTGGAGGASDCRSRAYGPHRRTPAGIPMIRA